MATAARVFSKIRKKHHMEAAASSSKYPFMLRFCKSPADEPSALYHLYSPPAGEWHFVDAPPDLDDALIHSSNHGWLLLSQRENDRFFFFHPSTGNTIYLPDCRRNDCSRMGFSAPPTSPDCVVFALEEPAVGTSYVPVAFIRRGESRWTYNQKVLNKTTMRRRSNYDLYPKRWLPPSDDRNGGRGGRRRRTLPFKLRRRRNYLWPIPCTSGFEWAESRTAPVFHKGAFYCLDQYGRLGVFKPPTKHPAAATESEIETRTQILGLRRCKEETEKKEEAEGSTLWTLLDTKHPAFVADLHSENYLMKSPCIGGEGEELISVVVGSRRESVRVLKFNENLKLWQYVSDLQGRVAFLSPTSSVIMSCKEVGIPGLDNTVHFTRLRGRQQGHVFYSLSTAKFHSMGDKKYASEDLLGTNIPLNCTWIPNFQYISDRQLDWSLSNPDEGCYKAREEVINEGEGAQKEEEQEEEEAERPWIVMSHGEKLEEEKITFVDLATGVYHSREASTMEERLRGKRLYGRGHGRVLLMDLEARDSVLLNTKTMAFDSLPTWDDDDDFVYQCCLLHMAPADDGGTSELVVMVFGEDGDSEGVAMYCRVGDKEWTISKGGAQVLGAAACQGKIYGLGAPPRGRLKFVEIKLRPSYRVKIIEEDRVGLIQPSLKGSKDIRRYVVESCGELLYFHQCFAGDDYTSRGANVVLDIRVFRIDIERMRLKEVEDLGDRAFFFSWSRRTDFVGWGVTNLKIHCTGSGGFGCRASKFGFKRNTIYLVNPHDSNLYVYDYADRSVLVTSPCPEVGRCCSMHDIVMCR